MKRLPKTKEAIRARKRVVAARKRVDAEDIYEKCLALGRVGDLKGASRSLHEDAEKMLTGKRQGEAGKTDLAKAAVYLLSLCAEISVPPPSHLLCAFELLLNVRPDGIGDDAARVAFAAQFPTMEDVPVAGLTRAHVMTHEYQFEARVDSQPDGTVVVSGSMPIKEKLAKPIGKPLARKTASALKDDQNFAKKVEEAKSRGTPQYLEERKTADARAKRGANQTAQLRAVIACAAAEANAAPTQQYLDGTPGSQSGKPPGPNTEKNMAASHGPNIRMLSPNPIR
jgi:hypothetical protein